VFHWWNFSYGKT